MVAMLAEGLVSSLAGQHLYIITIVHSQAGPYSAVLVEVGPCVSIGMTARVMTIIKSDNSIFIQM